MVGDWSGDWKRRVKVVVKVKVLFGAAELGDS